MSDIFQDRLSPPQTADVLGVTTGTLAVWRCTQRYSLPFVRIGRKIFYKGADVQNFIDQRTVGREEGCDSE